jgi:nitrite reductase (NADH) small subunit
MTTQKWIAIGNLADIPQTGARVVQTPQGNIALFRTGDNQVFALGDKCPHRGGPLSQGMVHGHRVTCPMHGLNIDLESGNAVAPDKGCTPHYPVRLEGEVIYLSLELEKCCTDHA